MVNEYTFKKACVVIIELTFLRNFYKINELIHVVLINAYKLVTVSLDFYKNNI